MESKQSVFIINFLDAGEMDRNKDRSDFDKDQTVMARRLDQSPDLHSSIVLRGIKKSISALAHNNSATGLKAHLKVNVLFTNPIVYNCRETD